MFYVCMCFVSSFFLYFFISLCIVSVYIYLFRYVFRSLGRDSSNSLFGSLVIYLVRCCQSLFM